MRTALLFQIPSLFAVASLSAATYFVDFAGGDDAADGRTPESAWKHSPGDKEVAEAPKSVKLLAGDVVRFKGGVAYRGEIRVQGSGAEGKPIVFDGNSDGGFGEGRAIFDGARMITGWRRAASADEVGGNAKWKEIMIADLDADLTSNFGQGKFVLHRDTNPERQAPWQRVFLIDSEKRVLPVAQFPKPEDPFFPDLPAGFQTSPVALSDDYPHKIYYEKGSKGNRTLPLIAITYGGAAPVVEPFDGGTVSVEMDVARSIAEIGFTLYRPKSTPVPERIEFLADGKLVLSAKVDAKDESMQRFKLPAAVSARKLTFRLRHSNTDKRWTKLQQIAAFTADGENVIQREISTVIEDPERLKGRAPDLYKGMFVGAHGGNNHVYFARVKDYDPATGTLTVPHFTASTYKETKYAFFNSPRLISLPGEWCLAPLKDGRTRVFLLPEKLEGGQPVDIGYPVLQTALAIEGASHIEVRGFLMQRYASGKGGVSVSSLHRVRPTGIRISNCEVRFMSGSSGISLSHADDVVVEDCHVHHCPGWTVGIYVNRVKGYVLRGNRVDYNSGSGIRHYEAKDGVLEGNAVLNHYGMHSSGLNFYEGCSDIRFEGNYVQNVIAINRNAENLTFRNNVVDSQERNAVSVAMWMSGRVGGRDIKNLVFEKNTFVNVSDEASWATAIFVQGGAGAPQGLVIRDNVLHRLRPPVPGTIEGNLFLHETDKSVAGSGSMVVSDPGALFRDAANGDFRRKPGGPMMGAGADIPPPLGERP